LKGFPDAAMDVAADGHDAVMEVVSDGRDGRHGGGCFVLRGSVFLCVVLSVGGEKGKYSALGL
jgi:hypothetical protein